MPPCRGCGKPIKFDSAVKTQNGKFIPLDMDGDKHQCPANPYNQNKQMDTTTVQTPQVQQSSASSPRAETMWLIPKEDWNGLKQSLEYLGDTQSNLSKQIDQLTQYYGTLVDMLQNNRGGGTQKSSQPSEDPFNDDGDSSREEGDFPER